MSASRGVRSRAPGWALARSIARDQRTLISTRHRPATRSALPNPKTISGSRKPGCREPPT